MSTPRRLLRGALFDVLRRISRTDDAREMARETLSGLLDGRPRIVGDMAQLPLTAPPYSDLGRIAEPTTVARYDVVFITARFRSGSTVLWNLFRHLPGCTAYYEPFNERRWFNPATRGDRIDRTHKQVEDYWREYEGLEDLGRNYRREWVDHNLLMEADFWAPDMKRYIELLIERAASRPVLQFNRVDFRLAWLRRNFPNAKIIHLYRHPRDQWCSSLTNPSAFGKHAASGSFEPHDHFYLHSWARDLRFHFPFLGESLDRHPYETFYFIWRLSYLYGIHYSDFSLAFERLVDDDTIVLRELLAAVGIEPSHVATLLPLIEKPRLERWREYADDAWFAERETRCEAVLADFFGRPLSEDSRSSPTKVDHDRYGKLSSEGSRFKADAQPAGH